MRFVKIFACAGQGMRPYVEVRDKANAWLQAHPEASIIASHTNLVADDATSEFALTLIVELPSSYGNEGA